MIDLWLDRQPVAQGLLPTTIADLGKCPSAQVTSAVRDYGGFVLIDDSGREFAVVAQRAADERS